MFTFLRNFFVSVVLSVSSIFVGHATPPPVQPIATSTHEASFSSASTTTQSARVVFVKSTPKTINRLQTTPTSASPTPPPNSMLCNGIYWSTCPATKDLVCPQDGGKAYCQPNTETPTNQQQNVATTTTANDSQKQAQYDELKTYSDLVFKSKEEFLQASEYINQASNSGNQGNYSLAISYSQSAITSANSAYNTLVNAQVPSDLPFSDLLNEHQNINLELLTNYKQIAQGINQFYINESVGNLLSNPVGNTLTDLQSQGQSLTSNLQAVTNKLYPIEKEYFPNFDVDLLWQNP